MIALFKTKNRRSQPMTMETCSSDKRMHEIMAPAALSGGTQFINDDGSETGD